MKKISQAKVKRIIKGFEVIIEHLSAIPGHDDLVERMNELLNEQRGTYIALLQEEQKRLADGSGKKPVGRPKKQAEDAAVPGGEAEASKADE